MSRQNIEPRIASWIVTHGWLVGAALIGGGFVHQASGKTALHLTAQSAQTAQQGRGPLAIIAAALGGK